MIFLSTSRLMIRRAVIILSLFIVLEACDSSSGTTPKPQETVSQDTISVQPSSEAEPKLVKQISLEDELLAQFINWDANAAQAVIELNQEWFTIIKQDNPEHFAKQIRLLKKLGDYPHLMDRFQEQPEIASLFVLALAALDDPNNLAQVLKGDDCDNLIMGLFMQHAAPDDAMALAKALKFHRTLICRLNKRGLLGSQALFIFPRDNPGAKEYDRWLKEILNTALIQSKDKLSSVIGLLFEQGRNIRGKMIDDEQFRYSFRSKLWPKFIRATNKTKTPYELYLSDPYLWQLLALPQGEEILAKWSWFLSLKQISNLTPAEVLFGRDAYPELMQPLIINAILAEDQNHCH